MKATLGSFVLVLLLAACNESRPAPEPALPESPLNPPSADGVACGEFSLTASPADAFVYVDGRFLGNSDPEKPLVAALAPGRYQIRITAPGHQDVIEEILVEAGQRAVLEAALAPWKVSVSQSQEPVRWGIGSRARGVLAKGDRARGEGARSRFEDLYLIEGKAGDRRILSANHQMRFLQIEVRTPKGEVVEVETTSKRPPGTPGSQFVYLTFPEDGTLEVFVRARLAFPKPFPYVVHHGRGLEDITNHFKPRFRRRRWPPRELLSEDELKAQAALRARIEAGDGK